MRARSWFMALVAVGAAVAAWILLAGDGGAPESAEDTPTAAGVETPRPSLATAPPVAAGAPERQGPSMRPARTCEIAGIVRRGGQPTTADVEVRLVATHGEDVTPGYGDRSHFPESRAAALARRRAPPVASARAGDDGSFAVRCLVRGTYVVTAAGLRGERGAAHAWLPVEGGRDEVQIDLEPHEQVLHGVVQHSDGTVWQGSVLVVPLEDSSQLSISWDVEPVGTDAEGRFAVGGLAAGFVRVLALGGDGQEAAGEPVRVPHEGEYRLVIEDGTFAVEGTVVDAASGSAVVGAEVVGVSEWRTDAAARLRTTSDGEGRFRVRVPVPEGVVWVRAAGFADLATPVAELRTDLEIRLAKAARVHGRVFAGSDGTAIGGVRVMLVPVRHWDDPGRDQGRVATTDAVGAYAIDAVAPGPYVFFARGAGWVASGYLEKEAPGTNPRSVDLAPGQDAVVDVAMVPGARVWGTVTDAQGGAVAGARVFALAEISFRRGTGAGARYSFASGDAEDAVATAADGSFEIASLVPGVVYEVSARPTGLPESEERRVTASAGDAPRVDLHIPSPRWVVVIVLDGSSGAPIPLAEVSVCVFPERGPDEEDEALSGFSIGRDNATGRTDSDGRVRVGPVGRGRLSVWAAAETYIRNEGGAAIAEPAPPSGDLVATVRLERAKGLTGRVLMPDGSPAEGATVRLDSAGRGLSSWTSITTDADGTFEFPELAAGEFELCARLSRGGEFEGTASASAGQSEVTLRLAEGVPPSRLVVRVLDPDGRPVPAAECRFYSESGGHNGPVEDGRAEFDLRDPEDASGAEGWLEIESAKGRDGSLLPLGRVRLDAVRTGQVLEVRLPPECAIVGRVVGPDGRGVSKARVRANPMGPPGEDWPTRDEPSLWRDADEVSTDESGAFRIGHLGSGLHRVFVLPPTTFAPPDPVRAGAGTADLVVRVRFALPVAVRVLDSDGKPVPGARVVFAMASTDRRDLTVANLFSEYGPGTEVVAGEDGRARLEGLDPKRPYVLGIRGPVGRSDLAEYVNPTWMPGDRTIRLAQGLVVAGVVRDPAGEPVSGVMVSCERRRGHETSRTTVADGTFRFTGLTAGRVTLDARLYSRETGDVVSRARATVEAGTEDVALVLTRRAK